MGIGSMAWHNLIAILLLKKPTLRVLKDYEIQKKVGKDPIFDSRKVGISGADFWEGKCKEVENNGK
ncbi:hypothetical protein QFZ73_006050 [Peribacillus sp. V2I11]|nr:hypothetical protein [Peribacillus sp. V2I11]